MIRLALWLAVAGCVSVVNRNAPVRTVGISLVLWTLVPSVAVYRLVGSGGGPLSAHAATWLVLVQAGVCLLSDGRALVSAFARHALTAAILVAFMVGALATSFLTGSGGLRLLLDQTAGPVAAFWLLVAYGPASESRLTWIRNVLLSLAVGQSLLSIVQSSLGRVMLFEADFARLYWFNPARFERWMGTTDSPLVLSLLVCSAAPLALGIRRTVFRLGSLLIMVGGVLVTQSRVGVLVMACVGAYLLWRGRMHLVTRMLALTVLVASTGRLLQTDLVSGVSSRLSNDTGSTAARSQALDFFLGRVDSMWWIGEGLLSNYEVARQGGLITSLESSYLMYAVDLGLPLATLYFGLQFALVARHAVQCDLPGAPAAGLIACGVQHSFSALGFSNAAGFVVWTVLGMIVAGSAHIGATSERYRTSAPRNAAMSSGV